jgi:Protein of unknown function (DUF1329)
MNTSCACVLAAFCSLLVAGEAVSGVSAEEAQKLGTTLTPMGAERAGNKDGTIPAWDGGYTKVPAGYKTGDPRPDPFASEKPVIVIDATNLPQHADRLAEGVQELIHKYPKTFHVNVYPTHRTAAAPQWVYDNIAKNATRATTKNGGLTLEGAYGGVPFPIPKDGYEVMWNHQLAWAGVAVDRPSNVWVKPVRGPAVLSATVTTYDQFPYYYPDGSAAEFKGIYDLRKNILTAPAYQAGNAVLYKTPVDQFNHPQDVWQYFPGQRRVRKVPNLAYDTPNFFASGVQNFDEFNVFFGPMDRYEMKLLGKKEMYVPYNMNGWWMADPAQKITDGHPNPDHMRFELHRVWVVEGTVIHGKRNVIVKRRFYVDEDTWQGVMGDGWDAAGSYWRLDLAFPVIVWELPGVITWTTLTYDFHTGIYCVPADVSKSLQPRQYIILSKRWSDSEFSPDTLAGESVR